MLLNDGPFLFSQASCGYLTRDFGRHTTCYRITGLIPVELKNLRSLEQLDCDNNHLSGKVVT